VDWTGDEDFERDHALALLTGTARLWMSLGHFGGDGDFHLDGVTGPDEYSAVVDDNTYTNLMAARNLRYAARTAASFPDEAEQQEISSAEIEDWRRAAAAISIPRNEHGMPEQDRGSTGHARWDFEATAAEKGYPLLLHAPYFDLYRKQVVKQADLVLAMHWCGDSFTREEKAAGFAYYEELTVRDSSLSACTQAVLAAEVGHLDLAYDYLTEAALMDLGDREHNTADGVHVASLAGAWIALVCGFGGMRDHDGRLSFAPRLPSVLSRLSFAVRWRGCKVRVVTTGDTARYTVEDGPDTALELVHHQTPFTLSTDEPVELPVPVLEPPGDTPRQPAGRQPLRPGG
jgi:alpha,alpha-trehalose phosphorylase